MERRPSRSTCMISLTFLLAAVTSCYSATCNSGGFYCLTKDVFQECVDSDFTSVEPYVCPTGTYCDMDCSFPCSSQSCSTCNSAGYYCPSLLQFQLCDTEDGNSPGSVVNFCPAGFVCSKNCNSPAVCTADACPVTCSETTRLAVPGNTASYYMCIVANDGSVIVREYRCPFGSRFNSTSKQCSSSTTGSFTCTTIGRFPNPANCYTYYICSRNFFTGIFKSYLYNCPYRSYFSPRLSICVRDSSVCSRNSVALDAPKTLSQAGAQICPSDYGRFKDPGNCSSYFMCSWSAGKLVPTSYTCPGSSLFNPVTSRCTNTSNYQCYSTNN